MTRPPRSRSVWHKKVDMIVDLQYGSTGKGLIAGYLAETLGHDVVVTANMPNAGHTYINDSGRTWIHKCLPNGIVSPNLRYVLIGPGAVFSEAQLFKEIHGSWDIFQTTDAEILIHPSAIVLQDAHAEAERNSLSRISSTMQGSGEALMSKLRRDPAQDFRACTVFKEGHEMHKLVTTHDEYMEVLYGANRILAEGAQGFSLGVNERFWPYCTSRDCTPARFLADMGIPVQMLDRVIGTLRTYPIRVGNTVDGFSGGCYEDQRETDWSQVGVEPELTTVTKRPRRIFTYSNKQILDAIDACMPDEVFLNFANYVSTDEVWNIMSHVDMAGSKVAYVGTGPKKSDVFTVTKYLEMPRGD